MSASAKPSKKKPRTYGPELARYINRNSRYNTFVTTLDQLYPQFSKLSRDHKRIIYDEMVRNKGYTKKYNDALSDLEKLQTSNQGPKSQQEFYQLMAAQLAQRGFRRDAGQAWNEGAQQIHEQQVGASQSVSRVTEEEMANTKYGPGVPAFGDTMHQALKDKMGIGAKPTIGTAKIGEYVEGVGIKTMQGFSAGVTKNVGGGRLDTRVDSGELGDVVAQGPQSVDTATKTLRGRFTESGSGHITAQGQSDQAHTSDALFEAFSWVPDGYGLGPTNALHTQNKQNDSLRFGMEHLAQPRTMESTDGPHGIPNEFMNAMTMEQLELYYATKVGERMLKQFSIENGFQDPPQVLTGEYNGFPSYKGLPRQTRGPSMLEPVVNNMAAYLPQFDPAGVFMNALPFVDTRKGTHSKRKLDVYNNLLV